MNQKKACTGWGAGSEKRMGLDHLFVPVYRADFTLEPAQMAKGKGNRR